MIGGGGMGNIGSDESRHVTLDAAVLLAFRAADVGGQLAAVLLMASEAALSVIIDSFRGFRVEMGIMAGNATQFLATRLKTTAGIHLFHMADGFLFVPLPSGGNVNGDKCLQGQTGTIIRQRPIAFLDPE